jgi:hypothetical protein
MFIKFLEHADLSFLEGQAPGTVPTFPERIHWNRGICRVPVWLQHGRGRPQGCASRGREERILRFLRTQGSATDTIAEAGAFWLAVTAFVAASPTVPAQFISFAAFAQATAGDPVPVGVIAPAAATGFVTDGAGARTAVIGAVKTIIVTWMTLRPALVAGTGLSKCLTEIGQLTNGGGGDCRKNTFDGGADHLATVELARKRFGQDTDLLIKFLKHSVFPLLRDSKLYIDRRLIALTH